MTMPRYVVAVLVSCIVAIACGGSDVELITGDVVVTMTMNDLPSQVTINKAATPNGRVEYFWEAILDVNNSGVIDEGDVALNVLQFKTPGAVEETVAIDELEAAMWSITANGNIAFESLVPVQVVGSTIRLVVDRSTFMSFGEITAATGVHFITIYYDDVSDRQYFDFVPAQGTLLDLSASGQASDPSGDVADTSNNNSELFPWIDFTEVTVSVF